MLGKCARTIALTAAIALGAGSAAEAAIGDGVLGGRGPLANATQIENAQFIFGGRNYCWYDDGWRGPGWYWCGNGWKLRQSLGRRLRLGRRRWLARRWRPRGGGGRLLAWRRLASRRYGRSAAAHGGVLVMAAVPGAPGGWGGGGWHGGGGHGGGRSWRPRRRPRRRRALPALTPSKRDEIASIIAAGRRRPAQSAGRFLFQGLGPGMSGRIPFAGRAPI